MAMQINHGPDFLFILRPGSRDFLFQPPKNEFVPVFNKLLFCPLFLAIKLVLVLIKRSFLIVKHCFGENDPIWPLLFSVFKRRFRTQQRRVSSVKTFQSFFHTILTVIDLANVEQCVAEVSLQASRLVDSCWDC